MNVFIVEMETLIVKTKNRQFNGICQDNKEDEKVYDAETFYSI